VFGRGLSEAREFEAARQAFEEAHGLYTNLQIWLDAGRVSHNRALLEEAAEQEPLPWHEQAVAWCERGLGQLSASMAEHRDLFKGEIEGSYLFCAGRYAKDTDHGSRQRLFRTLEAMRRVEALAALDAGEAQSAMEEAQPLLATHRAAYLAVQYTPEGVVFLILPPQGEAQVHTAEPQFMKSLAGLFERLTAAIAFASGAPRMSREERRVLSRAAKGLADSQEEAYRSLPDGVKEFLQQSPWEVFLSPYGEMHNLPHELLMTADGPLGLQRLLPRVHSLAELAAVLARQPDTQRRQPLVVGNPTHGGDFASLPSAEAFARWIATRLQRAGYELIPSGAPLLCDEASDRRVLEGMAHAPTLTIYDGHGGRDEAGEFLATAGQTEVRPREIARLPLKGGMVSYDCCVVGTTHYLRGGRYESHPNAALVAGASCALSAVHPLFDEPAAYFAQIQYELMLNPKDALPAGEAVLKARQEAHRKFDGNVLCWALHVLHGNPFTTLL
jgi:hypothetical protein